MRRIIDAREEIDPVAASALMQNSFKQLSAAAWQRGAQDHFLADTVPERLSTKIALASYCAAAFSERVMTGFLLMPEPTLLGMLFVHPDWLKQGIGRSLWEHARSRIEADHPAIKTVELNSTPYALGFYKSIGFVPVSEQFEVAGHHAVRMVCWLPARALGAEMTAK